MREWIGAPENWGSFRPRANDWFHDLATTVGKIASDATVLSGTVSLLEGAVSALTSGLSSLSGTVATHTTDLLTLFSRTDYRRVDFSFGPDPSYAYTSPAVENGKNLIREVYHTQPDGLGSVGTTIDGVRVSNNSSLQLSLFRTDGLTPVMEVDRISGRVKIPVVEAVTLSGVGTNWTPYGGVYGATVTARKGADGFVTIDGMWRSAGTTSSGWIISTLPVGFRPLVQESFIVMSSHASLVSRVDVLTNGQIQIVGSNQLAPNGNVSNAGITFYAGF